MSYSEERKIGFLLGRYSYDAETGVIHNLSTGVPVGARNGRGYLVVSVKFPDEQPKMYRAHRLAWLLMTGEWPKDGFHVDHKDRSGTNNKWSNLRLVSAKLNRKNRHDVSDVCPYAVIGWKPKFSKWAVFIGEKDPDIYSKRGFCGFFESDTEAMEYVDTLLKL